MPIFDFKCEDCGEVKEFLVLNRDKDSYNLGDCKCGANNWTKVVSVGAGNRYMGDIIPADIRAAGDMNGKIFN